jgi:spermidine/putrescine transport system substrate-binding protein
MAVIRRLIHALAAAMLAGGLTATAVAGDSLVISNWDGYMAPELLEKFTAATGIEAQQKQHASNEEIMDKIIAGAGGGSGFDVIFVAGPFAEALHRLELAAAIDHQQIPNLANLYPEAGELAHDPGNRYSVPYVWGTTGLCYRSDLVDGTPDSWNDLLKPTPDLQGRITMLSVDRWLMAAGLLALGYSINSRDETQINAARDLLIAARPHLLAYDNTTFYSKLVSGEASLAHAWDGWCNYAIAENDKIVFTVPKEGSDLWVDTMVIPGASENKAAAHQFINFVLGEEVGVRVASRILYKTPNRAAMEALDPGLYQTFSNLQMTPAELTKNEQLRDLGNAQQAYSRAATGIRASQ